LLGGLLLFGHGCGGKKETGATLSGPITLDDKPVTFGTVVVLGPDGKEGSGTVVDGKYTVHNAPLGAVKVFLRIPDVSFGKGHIPEMPKDIDTKDMMKDQKGKFQESFPDMSKMKDKNMPPDARGQMSDENMKKLKEQMKSIEGLPEKYTKSDKTPFETTIEKGENSLAMAMRREGGK
jgi:hypothetical protein